MWPFIYGFYSYWYLYPLSIPSHAAWAFVLRRRFGAPIRVWWIVVTCYAVGMLPGAKLLFDITHHNVHPLRLLLVSHYLAGGMWGGPLVVLFLLVVSLRILDEKAWRRWLDYAALSLPVPMAVAKGACFSQGCCYGRPTSLPWGIQFPADGPMAPSGGALHPTQIYELLWCLAVLLLLLRLEATARWRGTLLVWFLVLYCGGRAVVEFFYGADRIAIAGVSVSQAICAVTFLCSSALLVAWRRRRLANRFPVRV